MKIPFLNSLLLLLAALTLTACGGGKGGPPEGMAMPAVIAPVVEHTSEASIAVTGTFEAPELTELSAVSNGTITGIHFQEGARVEKGALLIELDIERARAEHSVAKSQLKLARLNYERAQQLIASSTISQDDYDQAQANFNTAEGALVVAEENLKDRSIRAPFSGVVGERHISLGQFVRTGDPIATILMNDPLEFVMNVPERFVPRLELDQEVSVYLGFTQPITGKIAFIAPALDTHTRTLMVKAIVPNPTGQLRPGMFAEGAVHTAPTAPELRIPEIAVTYRKDQAFVVVRNAEGVAEFRPVTLGEQRKGYAVVIEGLKKGEQVVAEGYQKLGPGSLIAIAPESARYGITPPEASDTAE